MEWLILALCEFLSGSLNAIIIFAAFVEAVLSLFCAINLSGLKKQVVALNGGGRKRTGPAQKIGKGQIATTYETKIVRNWQEFDDFRNNYQKKYGSYSIFSLIIQLFPLLGILGTVAGLYISMNEQNGAQSLYAGVGFALSSTVLGIIFAIIFKIVDVFFAKMVNDIDDNIDRYEKNYGVENEEAQHNRS